MTETRTNQELLGYRLIEKIGAGGFGEVWKAEAPGGLHKAIKIVFGYHDDDLALGELKALNRVKALRHPFLLSLERIEIVDSQLVVVTELADCSMKDRFVECIQAGMKGIPRDELIGYMSDAADGLDFLCNKYLLQHLDVKPDNLLLVGDHVKVADYGLVKDIRDNASMLNGMTPTYSPPEVFDGRPSQLSDQYSLAIVYQEMLTGERPFDGTTTQELARQHMLGHPNLDPLPRGDQPVVAKSLSKEPNHRYPSCKQFVEQLARRKHIVSTKVADEPKVDFNEATMVLSNSEIPKKHSTEMALRLPPIECDGDYAALHPTLVIGVGRTGTKIVSQMKHRLAQRFGRDDELPAINLLCIDSDIHDLAEISNASELVRFRDEETLGVPLRNAADYRKSGDNYSDWLSRRWIYNIPRSQSTEGIRPLGRLAFADHCDEIMDRLHQVAQKLGSAGDLDKSAVATGMPPNPTPRVFIVGCIGGGICSGMVGDLAYAVRTVLLEHGLSDEFVHGIFLYGLGKSLAESGLSAANAYTCLRELHHYSKLGYPGDESLDLPRFDEGETAAFSDIYLVHSGRDEFADHQTSITDYLFLDIVTGSNDFFKRCREGRTEDGKLRLRTFGCTRFDFQQDETRAKIANIVQDKLFTKWLTPVEKLPKFDVEAFVESEITSRDLNADHIIQKGDAVLEGPFGKDVRDGISQLAATQLEDDAVTAREAAAHILDRVRHMGEQRRDITQPTVNERLVRESELLVGDLWERCSELLDNKDVRFAGVRRIHDLIQERFRQIRAEFRRRSKRLQTRLDDMDRPPVVSEEEDDLVPIDNTRDPAELAEICFELAKIDISDSLATKITMSSAPLQEELTRIANLYESARTTSQTLAVKDTTREIKVPNYGEVIRGFLAEHFMLFVTLLETHIDRRFVDSFGGLRKLSANGNQNAFQLANEVYGQSRFLVAGSFQGINFDAVLDLAAPKAEDLKQIVNEALSAAIPRLTNCGGGLRAMLATPPATPGARLAKQCTDLFKTAPAVVRRTCGDLAICVEGEAVPAENIALLLMEESPTASEYIERISSRLDVEWIPLTGLG